VIKWVCFVLTCFGPALAAEIHTVYFLPMSNAFDQYLANRIRQAGLYEVVTNPEMADAVFTDAIGPVFEQRMVELYPPAAEQDTEEEEKKKDDTSAPRMTSFRRGRGNVFLVDRRTRRVVWSAYEPPKNTSPHELDKSAERVVQRMKKKP
jgi:hypothetical protein